MQNDWKIKKSRILHMKYNNLTNMLRACDKRNSYKRRQTLE